jgi:hypothetical protein
MLIVAKEGSIEITMDIHDHRPDLKAIYDEP